MPDTAEYTVFVDGPWFGRWTEVERGVPEIRVPGLQGHSGRYVRDTNAWPAVRFIWRCWG